MNHFDYDWVPDPQPSLQFGRFMRSGFVLSVEYREDTREERLHDRSTLVLGIGGQLGV